MIAGGAARQRQARQRLRPPQSPPAPSGPHPDEGTCTDTSSIPYEASPRPVRSDADVDLWAALRAGGEAGWP